MAAPAVAEPGRCVRRCSKAVSKYSTVMSVSAGVCVRRRRTTIDPFRRKPGKSTARAFAEAPPVLNPTHLTHVRLVNTGPHVLRMHNRV